MIIDRVRAFLVREFFREEAVEGLALDQPLGSSGLLDSIAMLKLVLFLEKEFDISIDSRDIVEDELETLRSIEALVRRKKKANSA